MTYEQQREHAKEKLKDILRTGHVGGQVVSIRKGHSVTWDDPLNPSWFGIPDGNRKYVVAPATIDIDDWLQLQAGTFGISVGEFEVSAYDPTVEQAKASIESGRNDIPTPVLELKASGSIPQEGRSRALGAKKAGATRMPIWVAVQVYR